jgi:hypothetical protein
LKTLLWTGYIVAEYLPTIYEALGLGPITEVAVGASNVLLTAGKEGKLHFPDYFVATLFI